MEAHKGRIWAENRLGRATGDAERPVLGARFIVQLARPRQIGSAGDEPTETMLMAQLCAWNGLGVLLRGKPGSGKSDLALQLMETPGTGFGISCIAAKLVADDQTALDAAQWQCCAPHAPDHCRACSKFAGSAC